MFEQRLAHINSDKVLQRLAHLESFYMQVAGVEEVIDPRFTFMVRLRAVRGGQSF